MVALLRSEMHAAVVVLVQETREVALPGGADPMSEPLQLIRKRVYELKAIAESLDHDGVYAAALEIAGCAALLEDQLAARRRPHDLSEMLR
jgi:hypothetical protein